MIWREHEAFVDRDTRPWDIASAVDSACLDGSERLWPVLCKPERGDRTAIHGILRTIRRDFRATFTAYHTIDYDLILGVDDVGDDFSDRPTVFVSFKDGRPLSRQMMQAKFRPSFGYPDDHLDIQITEDPHVNVFAASMRDMGWQDELFTRNGIDNGCEIFDLGPYLVDPEWRMRVATRVVDAWVR